VSGGGGQLTRAAAEGRRERRSNGNKFDSLHVNGLDDMSNNDDDGASDTDI
jgi:hypothetical protein